MGRVLFETDCINLQQAVNSTTQDRGPLGVLFREAKVQLQLGFIEYKILYCPRTCNTPAHVLAGVGSNDEFVGQHIWHSDLPVDVFCAVTADLIGLS